MELLKGCKLQNGEYRIEKKIGQGGFGITYLARWYKKLQGSMGSANVYSMVVIKEFFWSKYCNRDTDRNTVSISSIEGKEMMAQFKEKLKKEGKIISKFSHPHIVSVLDIFEENNTAYLVMQYIEGESLAEIIKREGKIDEIRALKYIKHICSALVEIHGKRILHLDIKPSNIIIDENDNAQLIDFGVSKQYDTTAQETSNTPIGVSAGYSPVEQYGTLKSFSPPTDIYALGATLYKMLTGETPLESTDRNQFDLAPITHISPEVSKKTEEAVSKAMSEKTRDRFQTVQEFWHALRKDNKPCQPSNIGKPKVPVYRQPAEEPSAEEVKVVRDKRIEALRERMRMPYQSTPHMVINPLSEPESESESSGFSKKILFGVLGVVAVLAVIYYLFDIDESAKYASNNVVNPATVTNDERVGAKESPQVLPAGIQPSGDKGLEDKTKLGTRRNMDEKAMQAAEYVHQANSVFYNKNLGTARYDQSFKLYMKAKEMGGDVSSGYQNFLSMAQMLIDNGSGFDDNVKMELQYAQKLNNTQEVRNLLAKCK